MLYLEDYDFTILENGLNTQKNVDFSGSTSVKLPAGTQIGGSSVAALGIVTSTSANALSVGANGSTNPVLNVDASATSVATGIDVVGKAAASGVNISVISSGTNENLEIDAKGSGTITLNSTGTGNIVSGADVTPASGKRFVPDAGSATSTAHAATINKQAGQITTESLTTAAGTDYTFTLTNSLIAATSTVLASVGLGTATTGTPAVAYITPAAGSATIVIQNIASSAALNGTITINFIVFN